MKARTQKRIFGTSLLELMVAVGILALLASVVFSWMQWERDRHAIERTVSGFHAVSEAVAAYRIDHKTWPATFNDLSPFLQNFPIHSPSTAGSNGQGNPYSIRVTLGELRISTTVPSQYHARIVENRLGSAVAVTHAPDTHTITMGMGVPGNATLLESTLLVDGSNAMVAPLPITHHQWFPVRVILHT